MKRIIFIVACLVSSATLQAQYIDYLPWSTANCNAFSNSPSIGGYIHRSILGQPKFDNVEGAVALECYRENSGMVAKSAAYSVSQNFYQGHIYKITMRTKQQNAASTWSYIELGLHSGYLASSNGCNGQAQDVTEPYPGGDRFDAANSYYTSHDVYLHPTQNADKIRIKAVADPATTPTKVFIRQLIIQDLTPDFTLTASSGTRRCGTNVAVTYTINNPTNASMNHYVFYPQPGMWLYQGNPAPAEIITSNNSITLTPLPCVTNATVGGRAYTATLGNALTNTAVMTVTLPDYTIAGPGALPAISANYDLKGNPNIFPLPPPGFPCNATLNWSLSPNPVGAILSQEILTTVGVSPRPLSREEGTVVLNAEITGCGVTKTVSRNIVITQPFSALNKGVDALQSNLPWSLKTLSPNPTEGKFTIELTRPVDKAEITIKDISGKIISSTTAVGSVALVDISSAASGVYLVEVSAENHSVVQKIVKK